MIQIIPENRRRSIGQALAGGFAEGLVPAIQQYIQQSQQAQQQAAQSERSRQQARALSAVTGMDLSDILDPQLQKVALGEHLKGKSALEKELFKQQMKAENQRQLFGELGLDDLATAGETFPERKPLASSVSDSSINIPEENLDNEKPVSQTPELIPDKTIAKIAAVNPAIARDLRDRNKSILKERARVEDIQIAKAKQARAEEISFHKESQAYDDQLLKSTKIAKNQIESLNNVKKAIASGNVTPGKLANLFKNNMGGWGDKLSNALLNQDQATILASIPGLLEGWKEVFGVRLSDADLRVLQDKLPDIGKSPEANNAIVKIMDKYAEMTLLRGKIAKEIKDKNKGLRPLGYGEKVEERFDQMTAPVRVVNPKTGNIIEIPAYKVSSAIENGAMLADE